MATSYAFDDRNIRWYPLGDFKHFVFAVLNVDEQKKVVDVIAKFEPNKQIFLHVHRAFANLFVVQGEHRIYEPNGEIKTVRPAGSYTTYAPGDAHREGGGDEVCIVFYSFRLDDETLWDVLDDDLNVVGSATMEDLIGLSKEQKKDQPALQ